MFESLNFETKFKLGIPIYYLNIVGYFSGQHIYLHIYYFLSYILYNLL